MLGVKAVNEKNQQIDFTNNNNYAVISVSGILPPLASVNTASLATKDGSLFNSARLTNRNIVLSVVPRGAIEANRVALYTYFKTKKPIRLYFTTGSRSVFIDGHVESINGDLFSMTEIIQISVVCPDPWFKAVTPVVVNFDVVSHSADINNASDDETGFVAEFTAAGAVSDIVLTNSTTGKSFTLTYDLVSGDKVVLNTRRGEKGIKLIRGGVETNILNYVDVSSNCLQLEMGANTLVFSCTSGIANLSAKLTLQPIFEGV